MEGGCELKTKGLVLVLGAYAWFLFDSEEA